MGPELAAALVILGFVGFIMVGMIGFYYLQCIQSPLDTLLIE